MQMRIVKRFPDRIDAINALMEKDAAFREICSDFEEAKDIFAEYCKSPDRSSNKSARCLELIKELEDEIIEALEEAGYQI